MSKLNIRSKAVAPTLTFQLKDANEDLLFNEDGTPCNVTIYGPGSKEYVAASQFKSEKLVAKVLRGREAKLTPQETQQAQVTFLVTVTKDIDVAYINDAGVELTGEEKLRAIYSDPEIGFIAEQVTSKLGDWGNFTPGSKKS